MAHIALVGGSFNPPHFGHQMIVMWLLSTGNAEQVWLIPTYRHPFNKCLESFEHRFEMCHLMAQSFTKNLVLVSSIEKKLEESYTINIINYLLDHYPNNHFSLVIGADILKEKDSWYKFNEIERLVPIIVIGRSGYPSPLNVIKLPAISSTYIRKQIACGKDISAFVPVNILTYIYAHELYKNNKSG